MRSNLSFPAMILLGLLLSTGCSQSAQGDLGTVSGTVTLDGQPYPNAEVTFAPQAGGRPSKGLTDEAGQYELIYIRTTRGAEPGSHKVMITTLPPQETAPTRSQNASFQEVLPPRYNKRSELIQEVEPGDNEINFDLKSK